MARKRLNKNVVVGLTLFGFFCAIVVSVLMLRQLQKSDPEHFVSLAQRYIEQEQWQQGAVFYLKAWEVSQDPQYLVTYGDMLLNAGEVGAALSAWEETLIRRPTFLPAHRRRVELRLELARLYGQSRDWRALLEAAQAMSGPEIERNPGDEALAQYATGMALAGLGASVEGGTERGMAAIRESVRLAPDEVDYALDLATLLVAQSDVAGGESIYRELMERYEGPGTKGSKVRLGYARHLARTRAPQHESEAEAAARFLEADALYRQSITLAGEDAETLYDAKLAYAMYLSARWARARAAQLSDAGEHFSKAEQMLQDCLALDALRFDAAVQLASLYRAAEKQDEVIEISRQRLAQGFSRKGVAAARNKLSLFRLLMLASDACLSKIVELDRTNGAADRSAREEWLTLARQLVDDAAGEFPGHPRMLSQSGRVKLAAGRDRDALEDLRRADELYTGSGVIDWENKTILARLHLRLNEPGAAKAVLEAAREQAAGRASAGFWLLYAHVLFQNDELTNPELSRALAQVAALDPDNEDAKRLQAAVFERQGKTQQALALTTSPTSTALLTAREQAIDGNADAAVETLRHALESDPAEPRLIGGAVQLLLSLQRMDEARQIVTAALALRPDEVTLKALEVATRAALTENERLAALRGLIEAEPDGFQRALSLTDFYIRAEDLHHALASVNQAEAHLLARDTPAALSATQAHHRMLLRTKLQLGAQLEDQAAMKEARDSAVKHNVDGAGGQAIVGQYHLYRQEVEQAILALRTAVTEQPTHTRALTSLGQCYQLQGRPEEARSWYERALAVNPNEPLAHRGLALLARVAGDAESYEKHLAVCAQLIPFDPWVRGEVVAKQERRDPRGAIARRQAQLKENPGDVENLQRLAALCEAANELSLADEYYTQLLTLAPDDRNRVVEASKYYRRTRRPARSLEVVTQYAKSRPSAAERADAQILVAAHHLAMEDLAAVEQTLLGAADIAETFEVCYSLGEFYLRSVQRADDALGWYDKAMALAREAQSPRLITVMAARVACALSRSVDDLSIARRLVAEFRAAFPEDPRGHLWESELYSREGRLDDAVASLSRFLEQRPAEPYALLQRAQLQAAQGRLPAAIADLEALKRAHPLALELEPRLLLARWQEQSGRRDLALRELEWLAAEAPNSPRAIEALVAAYVRQQRFTDADRMVTAQINRAANEPDARWFGLRGSVSLNQEEFDKALRDFRRAAEVSGYAADRVADVLDVYWIAERFAEGLEYCTAQANAERESPRVRSCCAKFLARSGRDAEAVAAFRDAMTLAMSQTPAMVRAVTANLVAAWPDSATALALFEVNPPGGSAARANDRILVRLYRLANQIEQAQERMERLISSATSDGERAELLLEQGELHQVHGDWVAARQAYEDVLRYAPQHWMALNNLAYILSDHLGAPQQALPYARAAVRLVDSADTLDTLGWIYVKLGNFASAIAELSRSVRLNPDAPLTFYHLAEAYRRNRQFGPAGDVLSNGLEVARLRGDDATLALLLASKERIDRNDDKP